MAEKISSRSDSKSDNLTGDQIQDVMDTLLYKALEPIVLYTDIFDNQLAHLLETITRNKKRKLTLLSREVATDVIVKVLISTDKIEKFRLIRTLGLERSYVHIFIKKFIDLKSQAFFDAYFAFTTSSSDKRERYRLYLDQCVADIGTSSRSELFICLSRSKECLELYYKFVASIVREYDKLCVTSAKKHCDINSNNHFDFNDVKQGLMHNVVLAINKYNAEKGALTSHIKWWLFNAQTCNTGDHEYNIAFTVPQGQKKKMATGGSDGQLNFSVSLDELIENEESEGNSLHSLLCSDFNIEKHVENSKSVDHIKRLSKFADPEGLARLSLDIGEFFSPKEKRKMQRVMSRLEQ